VAVLQLRRNGASTRRGKCRGDQPERSGVCILASVLVLSFPQALRANLGQIRLRVHRSRLLQHVCSCAPKPIQTCLDARIMR
jgi:hypothetical protein